MLIMYLIQLSHVKKIKEDKRRYAAFSGEDRRRYPTAGGKAKQQN